MLLDLLDECWQSRSSDQNQAVITNMYLEPDPAKGKYKVITLPMPGLTLFCNTSQNVIRAMYTMNSVLYVIASNKLYSINSSGTTTTLGTLSTSTGICKIRGITGDSDTNHQLCMSDSTYVYVYNIGTSTFTTLFQTTYIASVTISAVGSGYTSPTGVINDSTGTGATVSISQTGGQISSITITNRGSGYSNSPTITISDGGPGMGATGVVVTGFNAVPNNGIQDIENQDDYVFIANQNSMVYNICNVSDSTTWNALNFASKFQQPDNLTAILSHEAKIWLFGQQTTEVWYNSGNANFPFQPMQGTFLHYGCPAPLSIAVNGNYFIFLSSNGKGGYSLFQTLPRIYYYNPAPISNPPIDIQLQAMTTIADAQGRIYNLYGHEFYELTCPTGNKTFIYDIPKAQQADAQKGLWSYRTSYNTNTSSYGRFLANCQAYCYGYNLVGDYQTGNIYIQDINNYTENGTQIQRQIITPPGPTYQGGKRVFLDRLQLDVQTGIGANKTFTLEKSFDNGNTWILVNTYTVPNEGYRIYENRLGSGRLGIIFRITTTMNAYFSVLGFSAEIRVGNN